MDAQISSPNSSISRDRHDGDGGGAPAKPTMGTMATTMTMTTTKEQQRRQDRLVDLPNELFCLVAAHLEPRDIVRCRRVSRSWRAVFSGGDVSRDALRRHFPRAREVRAGGPAGRSRSPAAPDWSALLCRVACRYHHLRSARPREVEKVDVVREEMTDWPSGWPLGGGDRGGQPPSQQQQQQQQQHHHHHHHHFLGVETWARRLRVHGSMADLQHHDAPWTYDDGLLVYADRESGRYVAYDLETRRRVAVAGFDPSGKTVRRVRLSCGVLVFEWCEPEPFRRLDGDESGNNRDLIHRHYATAFDVRRYSPRSSASPPAAAGAQRFTAKAGTATASSMATLATSNPPSSSSSSSSSSTASPSLTGTGAGAGAGAPGIVLPEGDWGEVTFRSEWKMHFLGMPVNMRDRFYSTHSSTHYALYRWQPNVSRFGADDPVEMLTVWDISFPSAYRPSLDPDGSSQKAPDPDLAPHVVRRFSWRDLDHLGLLQGNTPTLREIRLDSGGGDKNLVNVYVHEEDHCWSVGPQAPIHAPRHHRVRATGVPVVGAGPRWVDECGSEDDIHLGFCSRIAAPPSSLPPSPSSWSSSWPGLAPCWRHEEFPHLVVSCVADAGAGVRVVARRGFMMESLSSTNQPKLSVKESGGAGLDNDGGGEGEGEGEAESEACFSQDMWKELLGRGRIFGDERWLVGEDRQGRVTIARF